ncbi:GLUG motif-containing protein, partial [Sulfuricurvum sp.]|uniref:beta strand repeat-containing protein n=1 Tax=Sulfuricurvum sp. TaxID=2025608 RepID=UPI00262BE8A0
GESWTPIGKYKYSNYGTDYSLDFKGHFNGLGHTISNLTMSGDFTYDGDGQAAGLFGNIATTANISSVRLSNASVTNNYTNNDSNWDKYTAQTAALVGAARDNSALINRDPTRPYLQPVIHNNIVYASDIKSIGDGSNVGAIVGAAQGAIISDNAVYSCEILAMGKAAGGIVGHAGNSTITDSHVDGSTIYSRLGNVGGIAGEIYHTIIDRAFVTGSLINAGPDLRPTTGFRAGGIVGVADGGSKINNSAVERSDITALQDAGGIVGKLADSIDDLGSDEPSTVSNSFYEHNSTYIGTEDASATNVITLGALDTAQYTTWKNAGKVAPTAQSLFGVADVNGYYTINNNADFRKLLALAYDPTVKVKLASSFTLDSGFYLPMFKGVIDGNSKTITGLSVSQGYNSHIGLIGRLLGGTVKNLTLSGVALDGYSYVGGVAGYTGGGSYTMIDGEAQYSNFPTISDVIVNNFVYSHTKEFNTATQNINTYINNIGAIAGYAEGATLSNLSATGSISATLTANNGGYDDAGFENIGGLFGGLSNSTLDTGNSSVTISANLISQTNNDGVGAYNIGGISGSVNSSIFKNITSSGNITMNITKNGSASIESIGGMFGSIDDSYVKTATASNLITFNTNADIYSVGGIAGYSSSSLFDTVTTSGLVSTDGITIGDTKIFSKDQEYIGGLIGDSYGIIIKNATSTRNITLQSDPLDSYVSSIGGLVGNARYSNISDSSYTGTIDVSTSTSGENIGGLVGYNRGEIDYHEQVRFGKIISATTTSENLAQRVVDEAALLAAYNARADVIAFKALGYTVQNNSRGNEGQPYTVSFRLKSPDNTEWGVIKNSTATVNIKAPNIENVGGLVGNMNTGDGGQIINSNVLALNGTSKVLGASNVGGLVGYNSYGNITDSHTAIEVVGNTDHGSSVGGLVGYNEGGSRSTYTHPQSYNYNEGGSWTYDTLQAANDALNARKEAFVTARLDENPGYVVDYVNAGVYTFNDTPNTIMIDLSLVKSTPTGTITNSYATGKVTGGNNTGGLVGEANSSHIETSYASGKVTGHDNVGGLVGYMLDSPTTILNSYAVGDVIGNDSIGGLVGFITNSTVTNAYASGAVTGTTNVGGLLGQVTGTTVNASFYNSTKNPTVADNSFGTAKTTAEMNSLATYTTDLGEAAWDIVIDSTLTKMFPQFASSESIWKMNPVATIDPGTAGSVIPTPEPTPTPTPEPTPTPTPEPTPTP